ISHTVRYRLFHQSIDVVSNTGPGLVNISQIRKSANDTMAIYTGDFAFVKAVALGERILPSISQWPPNSRFAAIWTLGSGRFSIEDARAVLQRLEREAPEKYQNDVSNALNGLPYYRQKKEDK